MLLMLLMDEHAAVPGEKAGLVLSMNKQAAVQHGSPVWKGARCCP